MKKTIVIKKSHEESGDAAYWVKQTPQQRLAALEEIRKEYIQWKSLIPVHNAAKCLGKKVV